MAAAVGLFHNLGLFALSDLQCTHLRQGVVNSSPSVTRDVLDHLGEGFSRVEQYMVLLPIPLHGAMVQGGGVRNWIPIAYGGNA
jgi:hypothetical protein